MIQRFLRSTALAALFSAAALAASAQVVLSPAQMRETAGRAVVAGQPQLGYDLAGALLERDATDLDALLIRSRAARDLGRYDEALEMARAAWAQADSDRARYAAALAQAQALSSSGRRLAAQVWLRRAVQAAPSDALKAQAARDFQYVRAQNPLSFSLSFSVAPSSNINNGSRNETSELFDLPIEFQLQGASRALSGVEVYGGVSARYRLVNSERKRTDLFFGGSHRTYLLSDDAKEIAPDAEGSDFASSTAFLGLQETYQLSGAKTQIGWNARVGASWYGGDPLYRYNRIGATYRRLLGKKSLADLSLTREGQDGLEGRDDATIWTARFGYGFALNNGDRLSLGLSLSQSESDADFLDYTRREVSARYAMAKPLGPAQFEFGLSVSDKRHDVSSYTSDGRQERSVGASITAVLPQADFYGFVPTVTLNAKKTEANIDLFEADEYGIQLGIRSAF